MNEQKLKELWWKARIGYNEQNCDPAVLAKFAELIVRECANLCKHEWDGDADTFLASEAHNECAEAIKEHFGVEE